MFSKVALFAVAAMAAFVAAAPAPADGISNSCNTGPVQCCDQTHASNSQEANFLVSLLGVVTGPLSGQVGVQCSPLTGLGVGSGSSCSSTPVCCDSNHFGGAIAIGCSPVNANL